MQSTRASQWMKRIFFFSFILVFILLSLKGDLDKYFLPDQIKIHLSEAGALAPVVYMAIMALAVVVSPIPSLPLDIAAVAFSGQSLEPSIPWWELPWALSSASSGSQHLGKCSAGLKKVLSGKIDSF